MSHIAASASILAVWISCSCSVARRHERVSPLREPQAQTSSLPEPQRKMSTLPEPQAEKRNQAVRLLQAIYVRPSDLCIDPSASEFEPIQTPKKLQDRLEVIRAVEGDVNFTFDEVQDQLGTTARIEGVLNRKSGSVRYRRNEPNYGDEPIQLHLLGNFGNPTRSFFVLHDAASSHCYDHFIHEDSKVGSSMTRTGRIGE